MAINWNDPLVQSTLIRGGLEIGGGIASGIGQGKAHDANLQAQRGQDQVAAMLAMLRERGDQADTAATNQRLGYQASGALIGNPLDIQGSRQDMALRRALLFDGPGGGPQYVTPGPSSTVGGYMAQNLPRYDSAKPFFTDTAMAGSEKPFWDTVGGLTNGSVGPNLQSSGYQGVGDVQGAISGGNAAKATAANLDAQNRMAQTNQTEAAIQQALGGGPNGSAKSSQKKEGGGFWKKLANIGLLAAPIVAAPFTGGTSLALIGAGAGAAQGALNGGGAKGALIGGAMGLASSSLAGKAMGNPSGYVKSGVGNVAKRLARPV